MESIILVGRSGTRNGTRSELMEHLLAVGCIFPFTGAAGIVLLFGVSSGGVAEPSEGSICPISFPNFSISDPISC